MTPSFNDDELISAYVDGRLSEQERVAFESRLRAEAGLRRRVMATQLLASEARQIAAVPAPRNFLLPRNAGVTRQPERGSAPSWFPTSLFRFGSVAAALAFVFLVGLDVMQSSTQTAMVAPAAAPAAPALEAAPPGPMIAEVTVQAVEATQVLPAPAPAERSAAQPAMVTVLPMETAMLPADATAAVLGEAVTGASGPSAMSADAASANGPQAAQPADKLAATATPQPTFAAPPASPSTEAVSSPATPLISLPRVLALIALIVAIAFGVLGWLRR